MRKFLDFTDFTKFTFICEPKISPSRDSICFTTARADLDKDCYIYSIWLYNIKDGGLRLLKTNCFQVRWHKRGDRILCMYRNSDKLSKIYVVYLYGEAYNIYETKDLIVNQVEWCGDKIVLVASTKSRGSGVHVINRVPIWFDGRGFIYNTISSIYVLNQYNGYIERISSEDLNVRLIAVSNGVDKIAFTALPIDEYNIYLSYIYLLDLRKESMVRVLDKSMYISALSWSPDDKYIVFRGHDFKRGFATHECIWILNLDTSELINLTSELNRNTSKRVYCDLRSPYCFHVDSYPIWDGRYIYFPVSDSGRYNIYRINVDTREIERVLVGDYVVESYDVHGDIIAYVKNSAVEPPELWIYANGDYGKVTNFNDEIIKHYHIAEPERFTFKASDGVEVEGWILKPFKCNDKVPAIVNIHGGPKSAFGYTFMFEHQLLASKGYAVIYLNPRGSDGYSEDFADIRGIYGTRDYMDIIEALDYIASRFEFIDPDRLGVTGISYGGFMTNWIITHTDRFKAAISQNGISDWISMFQTTDIGLFFCPDQIGGDPWSNTKEYIEKSPITHAKNVKTPVMFIHTIDDYRCWIDQAIRFYISLKYLGKEAELVLFDSGGHVFGWIGRPRYRVERLKHMVRWFDKHLKK